MSALMINLEDVVGHARWRMNCLTICLVDCMAIKRLTSARFLPAEHQHLSITTYLGKTATPIS